MEVKAVKEDMLHIVLDTRLDAECVSHTWDPILSQLQQKPLQSVQIDASGVEYCDSSGLSLLVKIEQTVQGTLTITGLKPQFQQLLDLFRPDTVAQADGPKTFFVGIAEDVGRAAAAAWQDLHAFVSFTGEVMVKFFRVLRVPHSLRWLDTLSIAEKSGADAVGITVLLGLLIGLILAFQSAVAMQQFGAEVFVADLVVLSLFRELGPLITALIMASRSGSAFAAELGTMKVNEEVDALVTMGLDPVHFLVLPRMIAVLLVLPLLTLFNHMAGLVGCGLVMNLLGYPLATFVNRLQVAASLGDLVGGLAKTFVFAVLIAGIGCLRGLQANKSASAVGDAATRAVVSSIVAIVIADGLFAVTYYFLGI